MNEKPISPKKIREMANLLKMTPEDLIICLNKKEGEPDSIIKRSLMTELENSESDFSKKITRFEKFLDNESTEKLIEKVKPLLNIKISLLVGGVGLLFTISLLVALCEPLEEHLKEIIPIILIFLTILLILISLAFAQLFFTTVYKAIKPKISPERYAIEEIAKIIKIIEDNVRD
jgi:ABC-type multidrug transport system fused ATPase/permease subunit